MHPLMSYVQTVAIATGLCAVALFLFSVIDALVRVIRRSATGLALVRRGAIELLAGAAALGWVGGTTWYFIRR